MNLLLESTIKISLVILVGLALTLLLRRRSAAVRHWVLATTIGCAAAIPLLTAVAPSWSVGFPRSSPVNPSPPKPAVAIGYVENVDVRAPDPSRSGLQEPGRGRPTIAQLLVAAWVMGAAINLAILFAGLGRLTRLASRARELGAGRWTELSRSLAAAHGLRRRIRILQGDHPALLVTWGLLAPKILLPPAATEWPDDRMRVVLAHELSHIARRDWAVQISAEILRAVYWFNPLLWLACRRLRQESEHACDDAVVNLGVEARDYATHLLELARSLAKHRRQWVPASAIAARPSSLHMRISAMLSANLDRHPLTRFARIATAIVLLAVTIPIAGFAQSTFFTLSGSVTDQSNAFLPGVRLVLTDSQKQAKHEVRSDRTGRFEFVGLPSAEYQLDTELPGFASGKRVVSVNGQDVQQNIKLAVGSLTETVTVSGAGDGLPSTVRQSDKRARPACEAPVSGGIGGQIRAPIRTRDARPQYPKPLWDSNVTGLVLLEGTIGTSGAFRELHVASAPHAALASAALDAVSQWQWDETLLNCVPVEVKITVYVNFSR